MQWLINLLNVKQHFKIADHLKKNFNIREKFNFLKHLCKNTNNKIQNTL